MNEQRQSEEQAAQDYYVYPPVEVKPPRRRRSSWILLVALPLLACVACVGLALVAYPAFSDRLTTQRIPITGGEPPQPILQDTATPQPSKEPGSNGISPVVPYGSVLTNRLEACGQSFHDLYLLERIAANQPDMMQSDTWQSRSKDAEKAFREDCQKLGTLPSAPPAYKDIDHWLKLAAAEVKPAAESFTVVMDNQDPIALSTSLDHLVKFVEYTHKAETLLNEIQDRKEI